MLETKLEVVHNRLLDIDCETGLLSEGLQAARDSDEDRVPAYMARLMQLARMHNALHAQGNVVVQQIRARGGAR